MTPANRKKPTASRRAEADSRGGRVTSLLSVSRGKEEYSEKEGDLDREDTTPFPCEINPSKRGMSESHREINR